MTNTTDCILYLMQYLMIPAFQALQISVSLYLGRSNDCGLDANDYYKSDHCT